ncbi:DUF4868 domain-containing protein [Streptococcus suis]|nr:DUF4868 domain-containing protein [Streptococcus suis]NQM38654.1 DUF4868 domain-containing protein [Streptococcus suis]
MTIQYLKTIFENVSTCATWSLQILKVSHSKRNGSSYFAREVTISPDGRLRDHVESLASKYSSNDGNELEQYSDCRVYDGSADAQVIYKLESASELISDEYVALLQAIANPDTEVNPLELKAQASVIKGDLLIDGNISSVKFISMQNPIITLKNKFFGSNGDFIELRDKVLTLRNSIDLVIVNDTIYLLNLSGEKLFNMERSYRSVCNNKIQLIEEKGIIEGFDSFKITASSGHNPRKFVSFNDTHLDKLSDKKSRKQIAEIFKIPLKNDNFDATQEGVSDKIVKLLCKRGMLDPFDDIPMEVSGSKTWS